MSDKHGLFSIGEIAGAIGITRRIILNYEDKGLIKPDFKESPTGNRYYSIDTFTQIRTIRVFQNMGLSLDEIRDYFQDTTDLQPLIKRLENMRDEINLNIEKLYERTNASKHKIFITTVSAQTVYGKVFRTPSLAQRSLLLRETAFEAMKKHGTDTTRRMYFTEYSLDDPDNLLYAVAVYPQSTGENILHIPCFDAVSLYHHGPYEDIPQARERLLAYAAQNRLTLSGRCRHLYVEGPPQHKDSSKFITQILLPIVKA